MIGRVGKVKNLLKLLGWMDSEHQQAVAGRSKYYISTRSGKRNELVMWLSVIATFTDSMEDCVVDK